MTDQQGTGSRRPRADVQQRIVEATMQLLLEMTPADLLTAVGSREIARRAGVSQPTVFHQFGSMAALADAVTAQVYNPGVLPLASMVAGIESIKAAGLPVEAARTFHRADFRRLSSDPGLRLRMGLWALGAGTTDTIYAEFLRITDARMAEFAGQLWEHWGREVRPPFDVPSLVAAHVALLNGLSIRHLIDPELSTEDKYSLVATALSLITLRAQGDQHSLADRLTEMNYYPLRHTQNGRSTTDKAATSRAAFMVAAAELFGSYGYEAVTVAQIARKAGLSASNLYRQFGSKSGLANELFRKQAGEFFADSADGPAECDSDVEPAEALIAHLREVATFVGNRVDHAPAYLNALMCRQPEPEVDPLLRMTWRLLCRASTGSGGQARERSEDDLLDDASAVLGLLIGRVLARPAESGPAQVGYVLDLCLPGLSNQQLPRAPLTTG